MEPLLLAQIWEKLYGRVVPCNYQTNFKIMAIIWCAAGPSGRVVSGVGLRPLDCWDYGFESHRVHRCLSVVIIVCCQVEVSASSWSLVQRSPTDCGASLCVI